MPFRLEIVTADREVFADDVEFVVVPGAEGELGILPRHAPLISSLKAGELRMRRAGQVEFFAIGGGFVQIRPDKVVVLADDAQHSEEIDESRAQEARERAETELRDHPERAADAVRALRFAQVRLQVAQRRTTRRPRREERESE
ncbi:MAG TPA: F0F1 ATP synthase subunit epsilon [Chloroflexota bacterium]|jgi:F-type H+-transporting ATPase subunit epsilon|nr:F0F1 ATP synthase subunit epsilon [Chloroflexota bacterium]